MVSLRPEKLTNFGFAFPKGSPHVSRTYMLAELTILLNYVTNKEASLEDYKEAIIDDNCLGKRTSRNRMISKRYLVELYSLDTSLLLFRALLYFWPRDPNGQPLYALLCAYCRDPFLRDTAKYILPLAEGAVVTRQTMEEYLEGIYPDRFSPGKLPSNAKNINSTWTQSGHLQGRARKIRTRLEPTPGSISYALLLGYITGARGQFLFETEFVKLLDCSKDNAITLAEEAAQKGWIVLNRVGDVIEVQFPNLITNQEMEWLREQS